MCFYEFEHLDKQSEIGFCKIANNNETKLLKQFFSSLLKNIKSREKNIEMNWKAIKTWCLTYMFPETIQDSLNILIT